MIELLEGRRDTSIIDASSELEPARRIYVRDVADCTYIERSDD